MAGVGADRLDAAPLAPDRRQGADDAGAAAQSLVAHSAVRDDSWPDDEPDPVRAAPVPDRLRLRGSSAGDRRHRCPVVHHVARTTLRRRVLPRVDGGAAPTRDRGSDRDQAGRGRRYHAVRGRRASRLVRPRPCACDVAWVRPGRPGPEGSSNRDSRARPARSSCSGAASISRRRATPAKPLRSIRVARSTTRPR